MGEAGRVLVSSDLNSDGGTNTTVTGNIDIVLVCAQSAGNIGSVARVIKNTGMGGLSLVEPVAFEDDNDAWAMACNASEVLKEARVSKTLKEALKGARFVAGSSRRKGKLRHPTLTLDEATGEILKHAARNPVSIVFGREDRGLLNEEVSLCDVLFEIPTHPGYPSLNLSHAVFAVAYALFTSGKDFRGELAPELAQREEVEKLYAHLEKTLRGLGYGEDDKGGEYLLSVIMKNFHRLFGRTGLMEKEVGMLRGILAKIDR